MYKYFAEKRVFEIKERGRHDIIYDSRATAAEDIESFFRTWKFYRLSRSLFVNVYRKRIIIY